MVAVVVFGALGTEWRRNVRVAEVSGLAGVLEADRVVMTMTLQRCLFVDFAMYRLVVDVAMAMAVLMFFDF